MIQQSVGSFCTKKSVFLLNTANVSTFDCDRYCKSIFCHMISVWIPFWKDLTKIQRKNRVVFFNHRLLLKRDICAENAGILGSPPETGPGAKRDRSSPVHEAGWTEQICSSSSRDGQKQGTKSSTNQWLFLVPLKGGRWHIIPQLAVYTTYIPLIYCFLVGGWTNPSEKYARQTGSWNPRDRDENNKCLSCHHLG